MMSAAEHRMRLVDLSLMLDEDLPGTWPGHMPFAQHNWSWFDNEAAPNHPMRSLGPYYTNFLIIDEHCGTHMDAPSHFLPPTPSGEQYRQAQTADAVPPDDLMGPLVVIDVSQLLRSGKPAESPLITPGALDAWQDDHGQIDARSIVVFRTGWDTYYTSGPEGDRYLDRPVRAGTGPGWPAPTPATVIALQEKGVVTIGTDAPSIAPVHAPVETHRVGLEAGMRYVEGLANLSSVPTRGAYFIFLPLKVARSSGAPGRAIALVLADNERSEATCPLTTFSLPQA